MHFDQSTLVLINWTILVLKLQRLEISLFQLGTEQFYTIIAHTTPRTLTSPSSFAMILFWSLLVLCWYWCTPGLSHFCTRPLYSVHLLFTLYLMCTENLYASIVWTLSNHLTYSELGYRLIVLTGQLYYQDGCIIRFWFTYRIIVFTGRLYCQNYSELYCQDTEWLCLGHQILTQMQNNCIIRTIVLSELLRIVLSGYRMVVFRSSDSNSDAE